MRPEQDMRKLTFGQAVREGLQQSMEADSSVIVIGEGVPDPKAIFGTTAGLREQFGRERVFDMPLAENGMTGVCIGAAMNGMRPVMVHQRIDFALLAMDQLVNNAAKWHFMFDGKASVPLVVRLIIGRGWGQGPQHSQSLQALFAHIPGLKVVMPATAYEAKGMMISAIEDNNPVIFIEHRWSHNIEDEVPEQPYRVPLDKAGIMRQGGKVTVVAFSYMALEAVRAANTLKSHGIDIDLINMRCVRPMDTESVIASLRKTGRLLVLDTGWRSGGLARELVARVVEEAFDLLALKPAIVASPDHPVATSHHLADVYYPDAQTIADAVLGLCGVDDAPTRDVVLSELKREGHLDVPYRDFSGPF